MNVVAREEQIHRAAERFASDLESTRTAFARAEQSMGREIRLRRLDDRPGSSSCSVRFVQSAHGGVGFLMHCFKTGEGGFFGLSRRPSPISLLGPAVTAQRAEETVERMEKEALAHAIASEGVSPERCSFSRSEADTGGVNGTGIGSGVRDYAASKGLLGFRRQTGAIVPPCPAIRYAARTYVLRERRVLFSGTPFWVARDGESERGEVRGVQFKFWSRRNATWRTRTIGRLTNAWVELPPDGGRAPVALVLAEGISTAWALHRLLDGSCRVIATLGISGLMRCAQMAARRWPGSAMAIVADVDRGGQGERAALAAAQAVGARPLSPFPRGTPATERATLRERGFDAWDLWARLGGKALEGGLEDFARLVA
ncbi:MAG: hypothetical protein LBM75_04760 [Myxococcales bacterium]|jgi:hypothetical protein|nr:hypothetical protein [Myxococcales bacterium]